MGKHHTKAQLPGGKEGPMEPLGLGTNMPVLGLYVWVFIFLCQLGTEASTWCVLWLSVQDISPPLSGTRVELQKHLEITWTSFTLCRLSTWLVSGVDLTSWRAAEPASQETDWRYRAPCDLALDFLHVLDLSRSKTQWPGGRAYCEGPSLDLPRAVMVVRNDADLL